MLEMTKHVLQRVSFDKTLFKKELVKALKWLKKEEQALLKAWCVATFGTQYGGLIQEVFQNVMS
jgi:hypothetical protein